jgi:hypothetical protein
MTNRLAARTPTFVLAMASSCAIASSSVAAMVPAGPESGPFGVSSTSEPHVCVRPGGGFVMAYDALVGEQFHPTVQLLDSSGLPVGSEVAVSAGMYDQVVGISCAANGDFYLAWEENNVGYFGRRFDETGTPVGPAVAFSLPSTTYVESIVLAPDGKVVVLGSTTPVKLRVFAQDGTPLGAETTTGVADVGYSVSTPIEISHESDGEFVVARRNQAQRFDSLGNPLGPVSSFGLDLPGLAEDEQYRTRLCRQPSGNLVAVGQNISFDNGPEDVHARIFDSNLQPLGAAFMANVTTTGAQETAFVGCGEDGEFVVAWIDETDYDLRARQFDASGSPLGGEFYPTQERRGSYPGIGTQPIAVSGSSYLFAHFASTGLPDSGIRVRAYCDDSDVGCTYTCPGGATDTDADGYPDACDPCTNAGGAQTTQSAKLSLKRKHWNFDLFSEQARFSRMRLGGQSALPAGFGGFAAIDPLSQPVRIRIEGASDTTIVDSVLTTNAYAGTGTAGWTSKSSGRVWDYRNSEPTPLEGIVGVRLKSGPEDTVRLTIKAKGSTYATTVAYPFLAGDVPPRAIVTFGPQAVAEIGGCTETQFAPAECSYSQSNMRSLTCKSD